MRVLIKKAQNRDAKAFIKIFEKYETELYKVAFIYAGNQDEALDIIQETAYRSFKSIKSLKEPKYMKTWLTRITINCSLDFIRDRKKNQMIDIDNVPLVNEDSHDFSENIDWKITLDNLIKHLSPQEKAVILLKFYNDLTIKQIGEVLELPIGSVKTILYRSLNKLRENIEGGYKNEQD
ncbi:sigma-70 family RNA polymerase sigma factor [Oceanobacillus kapialis]|uniref:sigma-70 family RNA polymerase sigma factor n=1 Tax=Oceanobacillus kapialis TaxID=481353 RepID=UPI00384D6783